jgi:small ligand-binding sensory domain FIST
LQPLTGDTGVRVVRIWPFELPEFSAGAAMPFASVLSTASDTSRAVEEVCAHALDRLKSSPDLALLFFSSDHLQDVEAIVSRVSKHLRAGCLLACPGEAIVAGGMEIEQSSAISLWVAKWSQPVTATGFSMELEETPEGFSLLGWPDDIDEADPKQAALLLLGDPFSFPVDAFLRQVNENRAGLRVMGGMASGIPGPETCRLLLGDRVVQGGAVGVLLRGSVRIRSIVSQGCRPIGRHMIITRGQDNIIAELGGKPPLVQLKALWDELSTHDRDLFERGLHVGRVINEYQGEFQRGDFLIRNVLGLDQETGSLAITDRIRVGQTVQFQIRDASTADEDLHALLQMDLSAHDNPPAGALLFTCNGRGTRLFSEPHHDARAIQSEVEGLPVAGFFAQGELGPIGGQNFIHGFTASIVLFED